MTLEELEKAYKISRKHNRRSKDQVEFERDYFSRMNQLLYDINNRCFVPKGCYSFIHYRPKPREVFAASVELKIIQTWVDQIIRPIIEKELCDRTYNNRKGMGTLAAIQRVINDIKEVSSQNQDCWIIKLDLKGYFPNISQQIAYDKLISLLKREYHGDQWDDLEYCINLACFSNPQFHAAKHARPDEYALIPDYKSLYTKPWGTGAAIGFLFWQIMTNFYLSDIDWWFINDIEPHYVRFVDDIVIVTSNKQEVLKAISILRQKLKDVNVQMHPKKFYCQHYTKGLEFLGYHIKPGRMILNNKIVNRAIESSTYRGPVLRFQCKINSYAGLLRKGTNQKRLNEMMSKIRRKDVIVQPNKVILNN